MTLAAGFAEVAFEADEDMKRFRDYKLGIKQGIIFGVILALMGGAELYLTYRMTKLKAQIDTITLKWLPSAVAGASIKSTAAELRNMQLQQAIANDDATRKRLAGVMIELIDRIEANQDEYEALVGAPEILEIYRRYEEKWERYQELSFDFFSLVEEGRTVEAVDLLTGDAEVAYNNFSAVLDTLVSANETAASEAAWHASETYNRARKFSHILFVVAVVLAIVFATALVRLVTTPVTHLMGAARKVADGDVDVELDVLSKDEIGDLSRSFNQMTASLRKARNEILFQQEKLTEANTELAYKNRDLEEAMRLLQETQQQLVMREKMASLGNLVAGVAHEINNPVGAVMSAADTSSRSIEVIRGIIGDGMDLEKSSDAGQFRKALDILRENSKVTVTASKRIAEIVKSLKNFARLDEAEFQDANLHEGIDSTLTLLHHKLKNRITVEKHYGELPRVQCYPNQINQVFMNVLSNAEQAVMGEGTIAITTRREGPNAVVEIADTGRGIKQEQLNRVFDPGFTTKGVGVGTGLGLSITYNIIKRHHGDIRVESEPEKGTKVTIALPVYQPAVDPDA